VKRVRLGHQQGFVKLAVRHAADVFQNALFHVDLGIEADGALLVVDDDVAYLDAVVVQRFEFGYRLAVRQGNFRGGFLLFLLCRGFLGNGDVLGMGEAPGAGDEGYKEFERHADFF